MPRTSERAAAPQRGSYDAVIAGGGHNGLVAAVYLARAGLSVLVLERLGTFGGAAVSARVFPGVEARLSRYSYLVSLLPEKIVRDLGLPFAVRRRRIASYTPAVRGGRATGLLVDTGDAARTAASFRALTGSDRDHAGWRRFYGMAARVAQRVAPSLTEPLPGRAELRRAIDDDAAWEAFFERPLGEAIEAHLSDDLVRGVVLTDALIGTLVTAHDPSLRQNRCFLYHVVGGGTGEWNVPVGGMGALTGALVDAARAAGAELLADHEVTAVRTDGRTAEVAFRGTGTAGSGGASSGTPEAEAPPGAAAGAVSGATAGAASGATAGRAPEPGGDAEAGREFVVGARWVLANIAPYTLSRLLGEEPGPAPEGAQLKVNMLLRRLPRLRDASVSPADAFSGTFHIAESYRELEEAARQAQRGSLPAVQPSEVYCHTLTDPSILDGEPARQGWHTLTLFALHTPARLFTEAGTVQTATEAALSQLDRHLAEPIRDCLAVDGEGRPCVEAKSPLDVERELGMPGGHIFHRDLAFPYREEAEQRTGGDAHWGVETAHANVLVCGAGAVRGGGVSGIPGHNAAMAVLSRRRP